MEHVENGGSILGGSMEHYIKGELLGMGTYGKVVKVTHKEVRMYTPCNADLGCCEVFVRSRCASARAKQLYSLETTSFGSHS